MTLKNIIIGAIAGAFATTGAIAADLPSGGDGPADYVRVCDAHGGGFMEIPGSDACIKFSGEARTRYHVKKAGSADLAGNFDARGKIAVDAKRDTNFGTASVSLAIVFDADGVGQDGYKASLGGLGIGKVSNAGNATFGSYAGNFNHGLYHVDSSANGLAYNLDVGFGTSIAVSVHEPSSGNKFIPDVNAGVTLSQGWGTIKAGGGAIFHLSEGTKYDTMHADYMALTDAQVAALDDPADLSGLGFYAGGGAEIPIPGLSSTKFGLSGFFFSGALSKMGNFGPIDVYARIPECTMADATAGGHATVAACNTATNAGRPLLVTPKSTGTGDATRNYAVAADLTADDFKPESIQMMTLFKNPDYKVGQPDEPAAMMGHINEIKSNSGFSANGGLTHSFSSDIALHVNGGFHSASEGDYSASGFVAGGSFDYSPVAGMKFTVGGEFASRSVSFGGDDGPTKTAFEADAQPFDPSWGATVAISQSF